MIEGVVGLLEAARTKQASPLRRPAPVIIACRAGVWKTGAAALACAAAIAPARCAVHGLGAT